MYESVLMRSFRIAPKLVTSDRKCQFTPFIKVSNINQFCKNNELGTVNDSYKFNVRKL